MWWTVFFGYRNSFSVWHSSSALSHPAADMCDLGWETQSYDIKPIPADFDDVHGDLDDSDFRARLLAPCRPADLQSTYHGPSHALDPSSLFPQDLPTRFEAEEDSHGLTRAMCLFFRPFQMAVTDSEKNFSFMLRRPLRWPGGLFFGCPGLGGCWSSSQVRERTLLTDRSAFRSRAPSRMQATLRFCSYIVTMPASGACVTLTGGCPSLQSDAHTALNRTIFCHKSQVLEVLTADGLLLGSVEESARSCVCPPSWLCAPARLRV